MNNALDAALHHPRSTGATEVRAKVYPWQDQIPHDAYRETQANPIELQHFQKTGCQHVRVGLKPVKEFSEMIRLISLHDHHDKCPYI